MKLTFISIAAVTFISDVAPWNVDDRCTRRQLEEFRFDPNKAGQEQSTKIAQKIRRAPSGGPLSTDLHYVSDVVQVVGEDVGGAVNDRRELQSSTEFQLKMYWEAGYCWQEEWDERLWCLQCEGGSCSESDKLVIEECSSSSSQCFVYQGEKLKPCTRQGLCWNGEQLKPCDDSDDMQLIKGLQYDGNFEMHPNGNPDDCYANYHHHPKSGEKVGRLSCATAQTDKTSLWVMINKGGGGDSGGSGGDGGSGGGGEGGGGGDSGGSGGNQADFRGSEYCDSIECGLCQGMYFVRRRRFLSAMQVVLMKDLFRR